MKKEQRMCKWRVSLLAAVTILAGLITVSWSGKVEAAVENAAVSVTKAYPDVDNSWYLEVDDMTNVTASYYNMDVIVDDVKRTVAVEKKGDKFVIWPSFFCIIDKTAGVPKESLIIPEDTILRPIDPDNTGWTQEIEADRVKIAVQVEVYRLGSGWAVYSKIKDSSDAPVYYNIDNEGTYFVGSSGGVYAIQKDGADITGTKLTTVGTYDIVRVEQDTKFVQKVVLYKTGDTNGDGQTDIRDIIAIKKLLAGNTAQNLAGGYAADMNRSGTVDSTDMKALRYSLLYDTASMTKGDSVLNGVMPIMGYDGPDISTKRGEAGYEADFITTDIFQKIQDVGINMIVANRNEIGTKNEVSERMLQLAEDNSLKVYLTNGYINDPDNSDGIMQDGTQFAKQTAKYTGYASFAGYYITDEPTNTRLENYETAMKTIEPYANVHGYLNLFPYISEDLNTDMGGTEGNPTGEENYMKYLQNASRYGASALSYDLYLRGNGISSGALGLYKTYKIYSEDFYTNLDWARTVSYQEGKPFYAFVQVGTDFVKDTKATDQRNLTTVQEMYLEASAALAMGARGISYYSAVQPFEWAKTSETGVYDVYRSGLINTEGKENNGAGGENYEYYNAAKRINAYIAMVDEVLMYASNKGVVTNNITIKGYIDNAAIEAADEKAGVLKSVTGDNALVGCFDYYGEDAYMIVNTSTSASETVVLTFDTVQNIKQVQMGDSDWEITNSVSEVTVSLGAGESALVVSEACFVGEK